MKNYGINIEKERAEQDGTEWQFGALSQKCIAEIPEEKREDFLPKGEVQMALEDTMDCASRGPNNILAPKFTYGYQKKLFKPENLKWLEDNGYVEGGKIDFSDAFVAINSGTDRNGNSLKAPLDAIHNKGLIPKAMLPLEPWMNFDAYHNPKRITPKMVDLGAEFARRFTVNYEQVKREFFLGTLHMDFIDVAGFAWPDPGPDDIYPAVFDLPFNHCFILYKNPFSWAFDNYTDAHGSFEKRLATNYEFFDYGYRVFISKDDPFATAKQLSILQQILEWCAKRLAELKAKVGFA